MSLEMSKLKEGQVVRCWVDQKLFHVFLVNDDHTKAFAELCNEDRTCASQKLSIELTTDNLRFFDLVTIRTPRLQAKINDNKLFIKERFEPVFYGSEDNILKEVLATSQNQILLRVENEGKMYISIYDDEEATYEVLQECGEIKVVISDPDSEDYFLILENVPPKNGKPFRQNIYFWSGDGFAPLGLIPLSSDICEFDCERILAVTDHVIAIQKVVNNVSYLTYWCVGTNEFGSIIPIGTSGGCFEYPGSDKINVIPVASKLIIPLNTQWIIIDAASHTCVICNLFDLPDDVGLSSVIYINTGMPRYDGKVSVQILTSKYKTYSILGKVLP